MRNKSANNQKALLTALALILVISLAGCDFLPAGGGAADTPAPDAAAAESVSAETEAPAAPEATPEQPAQERHLLRFSAGRRLSDLRTDL